MYQKTEFLHSLLIGDVRKKGRWSVSIEKRDPIRAGEGLITSYQPFNCIYSKPRSLLLCVAHRVLSGDHSCIKDCFMDSDNNFAYLSALT
jgi:hypothetical protein